jgi:hypothetical protein
VLDIVGNGRSAGDVLSRVVRLKFGETEYELPVLTIGGNRRWQKELDSRLSGLLNALQKGGDDIPAIFAALGAQTDDLLELLISYDTTSVLPDRQTLEDTIYEDELLKAVQEVWRAANPLVAMTVETTMTVETDVAQESESSPPTSSPRRNGTGRPKRSRKV